MAKSSRILHGTRNWNGSQCTVLETIEMERGLNRDSSAIGTDTATVISFHGGSVNGETRAYSALGTPDANTTLLNTSYEDRAFSCNAPANCTCECQIVIQAAADGGFAGFCAGGDLASLNTIDMLVIDEHIDARFELRPELDPFSKDKKTKVKVSGSKGGIGTEIEFEYEWHKKLPRTGVFPIRPLSIKRTIGCESVRCTTTLGMSCWNNSWTGKSVRVTADFNNRITHVDVSVQCSCPSPKTYRLKPEPVTGDDATLIQSNVNRISETLDKLYSAHQGAVESLNETSQATKSLDKFESRILDRVDELSEVAVSEWYIDELNRLRKAISSTSEQAQNREPVKSAETENNLRQKLAHALNILSMQMMLERVRDLASEYVLFNQAELQALITQADQLAEES